MLAKLYSNNDTSNETSRGTSRQPSPLPDERGTGVVPGFSFEVLPPLKGTGTSSLFQTIEILAPFKPRHINITTHRAEYVYREVEGGLVERSRVRRRPGTIAIAAAIQQRWGIPVIPHIVCSGSTKTDIEYALLDLQFLGISDIFILRGDKAKEESMYQPTPGGYTHALELIEQVNRFNEGYFSDGTAMKVRGVPFEFGVAAYPEKHEEAPNLESDILVLLEKQRRGAKVAITQLFYDNEKYYAFVRQAREAGVTIPIIPGLKPLTKLSQLSTVPKTFRCDLPFELSEELRRCETDDEVKQVGIEWGINQCRDLIAHGVPSLHFYTLSAVDSIKKIAEEIY